jgi:hypothetical protein
MNRLLKPVFKIVAAVGIIFAAFFCRADNASKSRPMENRFLFIINVSSAMKSRTNGIEEAVVRLLETDMHGEFRKGDTIGLWTYNDELHAEFPMQVWSRERKTEITSDVERYLHHQHYGKRAHIEKIYPAIGQAMRMSERLTMILIYDPSEEVAGTQFDEEIAELQRDYARAFNAAHLPVVTVLAARNGAVFNYTVNFPSAVKIPHTAIPEPPPHTNAPPTNAIAIAVVPPVVVPKPPPRHFEIIMSGTNNLSHSTVENVSSPSNTPPASTNIIVIAAPAPITNVVVATAPPTPVSNVVVVAAAPPSNNAVTIAVPSPNPNTTVISTTDSAAAKNAPSTLAVASTPPNVSPTKSEPAPQPSVVASQPPQTPIPQKAVVPTEPVVTPAPVIATTPAANQSSIATPNPLPTEASKEEAPRRAQALPTPPTTPPPVAATGLRQVELFVMAISLLTIAIVLVVLVVRRSRGAGQTSLISQSIDRGR